MDRLPKESAHLNKRLRSYTQSGTSDTIQLTFADGSSAECDVLVGADGVKSTVRQGMFQDLAKRGRPEMLKYVEPFFSGTFAYRCLIPAEQLPPRDGGIHRARKEATMVRSFLQICGEECSYILHT